MSKVDDLLKAFKDNIGEWTCAYCNSNSGQPAAIFREIKKLGYLFEESSPGMWRLSLYCDKCGARRSHYKLLSLEPEVAAKARIGMNQATRARILRLFDSRDAFTGASITSTAEIDHKTPWTRLVNDVDACRMTDDELRSHFQLLTREHNLLKGRMCERCKQTGVRPPFFEISYWYAGDSRYAGVCDGCGWFDGARWREAINRVLN